MQGRDTGARFLLVCHSDLCAISSNLCDTVFSVGVPCAEYSKKMNNKGSFQAQRPHRRSLNNIFVSIKMHVLL